MSSRSHSTKFLQSAALFNGSNGASVSSSILEKYLVHCHSYGEVGINDAFYTLVTLFPMREPQRGRKFSDASRAISRGMCVRFRNCSRQSCRVLRECGSRMCRCIRCGVIRGCQFSYERPCDAAFAMRNLRRSLS